MSWTSFLPKIIVPVALSLLGKKFKQDVPKGGFMEKFGIKLQSGQSYLLGNFPLHWTWYFILIRMVTSMRMNGIFHREKR